MILYTGGTFDLFHHGHVQFLKRCKDFADKIVVGLNTDEFVEQYKWQPPVMSLAERLQIVQACKYVDKVVVNSGGSDSKPIIDEIGPNIIAVGSDWTYKDYYDQMDFNQKWLDDRGIITMFIPYTKDISTTIIVNRLKDLNRQNP